MCVRIFFIREAEEEKNIQISYVNSIYHYLLFHIILFHHYLPIR